MAVFAGPGTTCPKCKYKRTASENAPDYECPQCGIVYEKVFRPNVKKTSIGEATASVGNQAVKPKSIATGLVSLIAIFAWLVMFNVNKATDSEPRDAPLEKRYPGPWNEDGQLDISKTLVSTGTTGCGQYKYKASALDTAEYLVHCSRDGENWVAYLVWTQTNKVLGPHSIGE